jgi:hypothetical protein
MAEASKPFGRREMITQLSLYSDVQLNELIWPVSGDDMPQSLESVPDVCYRKNVP